jgi:hypothetical protein
MGKKPKDQEQFHLNPDVDKLIANGPNDHRISAAIDTTVQRNSYPQYLPDRYQQDLMDMMKVRLPTQNMFTTSPDLGHQQSASQRGWDELSRSQDLVQLRMHLSQLVQTEDYIVDGGVRFAPVPISSLESIMAVVETLVKYGPPKRERMRLSYPEVADLLRNVDRAMSQNALRNMPDEYRRLLQPGQEPLAGGAVLVALSILRMLP